MSWHGIETFEDVAALAPEAFAALRRMRGCALRSELRVGGTTPPLDRYADQFNLDVASLTAEQRSDAAAVLGADLFGFVQTIWALDMCDRIDHAWRQLFGVEPVTGDPSDTGDGQAPTDAAAMWAAVEAFLPAVARLTVLDPVITEVVRLRGARAHHCRLCRSLRSVGAIEAGADDDTFLAIDRYETSELDERLKVALRLTDAVIWEPRSWPAGLADTVRRAFAPGEAVEIVLDVVRNGANKIAVALEADQANVTDGVEYFTMDASGELTYGIDPATIGR